MALQVWLPLTKDLRNQGLSNVTVTNNEATFSSAGKLGGCYSFDGINDRIAINDISIPINSSSLCCWFKASNTTSADRYIISLNNTGGFSDQQLGVYQNGSNVNLISGGSACFSFTITEDTWYHVCITRKNNTVVTYLNGVKQSTLTVNDSLTGTHLCIGARCNSSSGAQVGAMYYFNGKVNDFRLYDHCLSPMEVKQLAQGLVLHYPLNRGGWGQENLLPVSSIGAYTPGCSLNFINGTQKMEVTYDTSGNYSFWYIPYSLFPTTDSWVLSFDITYKSGTAMTTIGGDDSSYTTTKIIIDGTIYTNAWSSGAPISFPSANTKHHVEVYGSVANGSHYLEIMANRSGGYKVAGVYLFENIKLEIGSKATPWCPNSSDALATTIGLNGTTEYDCSGFGNNGTRTGTFSWTSDTPKYSVSTKFNGTEKISANSLPSEVQSVSFWVKVPTIPSSYGICYVDSNTQTSIGFYNGNSFITSCTVSANVVLLGTTFKANEWNHIVLIKTGTNTRNVYCNGVLLTNGSNNSWVHNGNNLSLGWRDYASGNAGWFNGQLCDFRAYATALSADDVKSLYQNSAYIDSSGNVYGAVHSEV